MTDKGVARENIKWAINKALCGTRKIRFKIKQNCIDNLIYLVVMCNSGILEIAVEEKLIIMIIIDSQDWGPDSNRTIEAFLPNTFEGKDGMTQFIGRMEFALESIENIE